MARAAVLGALLTATALAAVETRTWRVASRAEMEKGTAEGVSVRGEGTLTLSPSSEEILAVDQPLVTALAAGPDGILYVGTGNEGSVLRLSRKGEARVLARELGLQVSALAVAPDGGLYVAWNPYGDISRIPPEEGASRETFLDLEETYVWDLELDERGRLYVATGDPSRLLRTKPGSEEVEELLASSERNLTALALGPDGTAYVGTEGEGLVLAVRAGERPRVLWDAPMRQIAALVTAPDGTLFAAAVGRPAGDGDEEESRPNPSAVARIRPEGRAEVLWRSEEDPVFSLALAEVGPGQEPLLLAGSGSEGRVFAIGGSPDEPASTDGLRTLLVDTSQEQVTAIVPLGGGRTRGEAAFTTANLGRVYRLGRERAAEGTWLSPVHDAGAVASWGAIRWEGSEPAGSRVRFETRSGQTEQPGPTWSSWEPVRGGMVQSPPARRLQGRAVLEAGRGGRSPEVRSLEIAYLQENLPPEVTEVVVHDPGLVYDKKLATKSIEREGPDRFSSDVDPESSPKPYSLLGWRTLSWDASDPNEDALRFRIELRPAGRDSASWFTLAEDLEGEAWAWDSRTLPDGRYEARITASDAASNPSSTALEGSRRSAPFLVDIAPPRIERVRVRKAGGSVVLTFSARDAEDVVASASVSVAGRPWRPILPVDGIPDEELESFETTLEDTTAGDLVVVRARDRTGNQGTAAAIVD